MDETFANVQSLMEQAISLIQKQRERHIHGEEFNAFEICRIGSEETRHSAIIAALLDPKGNHGLESKSLKIFFKEAGLPEFAEYCDDCEVKTEVTILGSACTENRERRMDIVISGHDLCVVVENKTNTVDHCKQLADYREWLDKQKVTNKALLYLTFYGSNATDKNIADDQYIRISYKNTLGNWLKQCEKESLVACRKVNTFFGQYADFIKNTLITEGKTMNQKELDDLLSSSQENFIAAKAIYSRFEKVQEEKYTQLFNAWAEDNTRPVKKDNKTLLPSAFDQLTFKSAHPDLLIAFEFASKDFCDFSYGLEWVNEQSKDKNHSGFQNFEGWIHDTNKWPWWPYYKYFKGDYRNPIYFPEFLSTRKEELYHALDTAYLEMQELVSKLPK